MNAPNFDHLIYVAQSESVVTDLDSINILMLIIKELEVIEVQVDFPRYCHSYFEKEDMIIDFMNLGYDKTDEIIQKATWFPPQEVTLSPLPN